MKRNLFLLAVILMLSFLPFHAGATQHQEKLMLLVHHHDGSPQQVRGAVVTACPDVGACQTGVTTKIGRVMFQFPVEAAYVDILVEAPEESDMCDVSVRVPLTRAGGGNDTWVYVFMPNCL